MKPVRGFTLVELVTVIVLTGILSLVVWRNLSLPIRGFADLTARNEATGAVRLAMNRMTREIRLALPNSVRVSSDGSALEMLRLSGGGRYRVEADPGNPATDPINLSATADTFSVLGSWNIPSTVRTSSGVAGCLAGTADCLAIYNTGNPATCAAQTAGTRTNAWCGDNLAGIASVNTTTGIVSFNRTDGTTTFPTGSPVNRFFVVDTTVSFVCTGGQLRRYAGYAISAVQSAPPAGSYALLASNVASCSFSYQAGSLSRAGLVALSLTLNLTNGENRTETVTLFDQLQLPNSP